MKKQIIAKLLVLAMVLAMVPVTVLAASAAGSNLGYSANYGYYSIGKDTYVVIKPLSANSNKLTLTIENGVGYAIVNDSVIDSFANLVEDGKMVVKLEGKVDHISFTSSAKALSALAVKTEADLVFETNFATITFPNDLLAGLGNVGTSNIFMHKADNGASVDMEAAGEDVDSSSVKSVAVEAE